MYKFRYRIKCRECGKITTVDYTNLGYPEYSEFTRWANMHSTTPISKECSCSEDMITFQDIVSITKNK